MLSFTKKNESLIVSFEALTDDMTPIISQFDSDCKHLIFDLMNIKNLDFIPLSKFTTFGKNLVGQNSFVLVSKQIVNEQFLIVPTIQEAFDIIEFEDIERQLNF